MFNEGDRVNTPGGLATIVYFIMAASNTNKVGSVCVLLDNSRDPYNKSIYPINQIEKVLEK